MPKLINHYQIKNWYMILWMNEELIIRRQMLHPTVRLRQQIIRRMHQKLSSNIFIYFNCYLEAVTDESLSN